MSVTTRGGMDYNKRINKDKTDTHIIDTNIELVNRVRSLAKFTVRTRYLTYPSGAGGGGNMVNSIAHACLVATVMHCTKPWTTKHKSIAQVYLLNINVL